MRGRDRLGTDAGFALLDLLVALAVAGLAGSILVGLVRFVDARNAAATKRQLAYENAFATERLLRTLVAHAPPFVPGPEPSAAVFGRRDEASVLSTGPGILGLPRAAVFALRVEPRAPRSALVLVWSEDERGTSRRTLAEDVAEAAFAFLPWSADPSRAVWRSEWRPTDGPLAAVRLTVRSTRAARPFVAVIPIEADMPAACLRDPRLGACGRRDFGR